MNPAQISFAQAGRSTGAVIARRNEDAVAKAAKRKVERAQEPSPKSLMDRLAALQAEFAAKLQKQEKK